MEIKSTNENRRDFLKTLIPTGAMLCIGCPSALAIKDKTNLFEEEDFDIKVKMEFSISYEDYFSARFNHFISTMENFARYMGRDNLINMLKKSTDDKYADKKPNMEIKSAKDYITPIMESEYFKARLDKEVVKLTDNVCEFNVTNCLWAKTFIRKNAGDIGYANTCHGDFAATKAENPKLRMERTKTLMQGHDCCDFRFIWEG